MRAKIHLFWMTLLLFVVSSASLAQIEFRRQSFSPQNFQNPELLQEACNGAAESFWCERLDEELTLISGKSIDVMLSEAGEVMALFARQQQGSDFGGNYRLDDGQNLIPYDALIPGGSVLIDGEYVVPDEIESSWQTQGDEEYLGEFRYQLGDVTVEKTINVSNIRNTLRVSLRVVRPEAEVDDADEAEDDDDALVGGDALLEPGEDVTIKYAFPGIARQESPPVKVGSGDSYTLNPAAQEVGNPRYISLQSNNRNSGFAIIMRPARELTSHDMNAYPFAPSQIAMSKTLGAEPGSEVVFDVEVYGGPNELISFQQQGYLDLPGLFNPNILGRLSLGILYVLQAIHGVVGVWGLSIILLTLLIRILVWPLMSAQTKSMAGMQQIQPQLQALQKKYKNNREKLTEETMKLYKEAGVNPAGGCLPLIVQMPILIMLWRVFMNYEFNEGFLWLPDLGLPDPYYLLPIMYVGVMVAQSFLMSRGNKQSLRQQLIMNLVFVFIIINFPAGVTLYWVVSMLVQILQQYLIQRSLPAPAKVSPAK